MPTPTYDLIASNVLASPATTVTFSSLNTVAAAYRDLVVVTVGASTDSFVYAYMRFNSDAGTYSYVYANGDGSAQASAGPGDNKIQLGGKASYYTTALQAVARIEIFDFAQTDKHKNQIIRFDSAGQATEMMASRWATTSAITSINLIMNVGSWATGSTFYLYGIVS